MRKFIVIICCFSVLCLMPMLIYDEYVFRQGEYKQTVFGSEVYDAIRHSLTKYPQVKRLIMGDSVTKQLYGTGLCNDSVLSLACNQAISMAGQYFLLKDYLTTNRETLPSDIYIILYAYSIRNNLDQFAYQYFLKPFNNEHYKPMMNTCLLHRIHKIPYYWTATRPFCRANNYSFKYTMPEDSYHWISPISAIYLDSIQELTSKNGIKLHLLSNPMEDAKRDIFDLMYNLSKENLEIDKQLSLWDEYYASVTFLADSLYEDHVHFYQHKIPKDYFAILK